jgi:DNA topoisomerase-2
MATDYPGANNMPYFFKDGMFGTRNHNGKDSASPRYISVKPVWWLPYVYKNEDFHIMEFRTDEGDDQEPIVFLPIIPMVLINGAEGIGSGHSTFIPKFNPLDIITWYKRRLGGSIYQNEPSPWYRGFTGLIEPATVRGSAIATAINERNDPINEEEELEELDELDSYDPTISLTHKAVKITGCMYSNGPNIEITEIPIRRSIHSYSVFLKELIDKGMLKDFRNNSDDNNARFTLESYTGGQTARELGLISFMGMSNMVLLDNNNCPIKYVNVTQILESFYQQRLGYYAKRKEFGLNEELRIIQELTEKHKFISEVVNGTIIIFKRKINELKQELSDKGYSKDLFNTISLSSCTQERVLELEEQIEQHIVKYNEINIVSLEGLWYTDLEEFEKVYKHHYKC